jgi:spore coat protein H
VSKIVFALPLCCSVFLAFACQGAAPSGDDNPIGSAARSNAEPTLPAAGSGGPITPVAGSGGSSTATPSQTPSTTAPPAAAGAAGATPATPAMTVPAEPAIARPDGWQAASHERGATPDYARVFAEDKVHRIDISMTREARQTMLDDLEMLLGEMGTTQPGGFGFPAPGGGNNMNGMMPRDPTDLVGGDPVYVPVTVRYDGGVWNHVAMRHKGNSSLASAWRTGVMKIGFRLNFDRYEMEHPEVTDQRFYGFGEMTFSSGFRDPSLIRDKLAEQVMRGLEIPTARCAFYQVFVDAGEGPVYWGLYTMIEDPSDQMIEAQFKDKSGNLYKPDGPAANWTRFEMDSFEKKSNKEAADYSDIMAAITALNAPRSDAQVWRAGLDAVFNVQSFWNVVALSRAIGHWDGYGVMSHNYYLYGDPSDNKRLMWISWDHNLAWQGQSFGRLSVLMDEVTEDWPLLRFLLDDPIYRAQYLEALRKTSAAPILQQPAFEALAGKLHAMIGPYVIGGSGQTGEKAPYSFITQPTDFQNALTDPNRGLFTSATSLRSAVDTALQ